MPKNRRRGRSHKVKAAKPQRKQPAANKPEIEPRDPIDLLQTIVGLRQFITSGFEPIISDAEIVVCFADIRGFTSYCRKLQGEMQDRRIQNFLKAYVRIFVEGLMQWFVLSEEELSATEADTSELRRMIVPTMYKNLGDGMMLTWEFPPDLNPTTQGRLTHHIMWFLDLIKQRFYFRFRNLIPVELDAYSNEVTELEIGFGVAKGHAWRMDFGHTVDYAGSIINLASRLQDFARPSGVVAHYDVSTWFFDQSVGDNDGHLAKLKTIKGYENEITVWISQDVDVNQEGMELLQPE